MASSGRREPLGAKRVKGFEEVFNWREETGETGRITEGRGEGGAKKFSWAVNEGKDGLEELGRGLFKGGLESGLGGERGVLEKGIKWVDREGEGF